MRGGALRKFNVHTPSGGNQKGGSLYRFSHMTPPFNGTWRQINAQRGAGVGDVFKDFKKGVGESWRGARRNKKPGRVFNSSHLVSGVKRSAADAITNEVKRQAVRKINDIFGVK